jgi:uncharacterized protein YkwD
VKDLLRNPNVLNLASFVTAGVGLGLMAFLIFINVYSQGNKPIKVVAIEGSSVVANGIAQTMLDFNQPFRIAGRAAKTSWGKNSLVGQDSGSAVVNGDNLRLASGIFYLQSEGNLNLTLGNNQQATLSLHNFSGAIFADTAIVVVISGTAKDAAGTSFSTNQEIKVSDTGTTQAGQFLRESLGTDQTWITLTQAVVDLGLSQKWLTDRTAPTITSTIPEAGQTIVGNSDPSSIQFFVSEPGSTITINGTTGQVGQDGKYTAQVALASGANSLTIVLRDEYGNVNQTSISYTKQETTQSPPVATCDPVLRQQILTLINSHRVDSGKPEVSLLNELTQVACNHAVWMHTNSCDSSARDCSIGKDAAGLAERCQLGLTSCKAENIHTGEPSSAQGIIDSWKQTHTSNQNLLGDFTSVGIGVTTAGYASLILR